MKIAFISNFYNHHQAPFSEAMNALTDGNYRFIATEPISEERLNMGWGREEIPAFVRMAWQSPEETADCQRFVDEADVVIIGSAPRRWLEHRLKAGKLTFYYSERIYKTGVPYHKLPVHFLRNLKHIIRHKNLYLLCASAYAPVDYAKTLTFLGKTYKWGYFTALKQYENVEALIDAKEKSSILWVSRFIELKHPELPIAVAKRLRDEGYTFTLRMIGSGELEEATKQAAKTEGLSDCVSFFGSMSPEEVRGHMENSEIFLFTSDRNEGWGAVLNESMNSACAVVANRAIGSVPFLLRDGENGYTYDTEEMLYEKVKALLDDAAARRRMAKEAYLTMTGEWNAENAAKKLLVLCEKMLSGEPKPTPFESGVCSKATILRDPQK